MILYDMIWYYLIWYDIVLYYICFSFEYVFVDTDSLWEPWTPKRRGKKASDDVMMTTAHQFVL